MSPPAARNPSPRLSSLESYLTHTPRFQSILLTLLLAAVIFGALAALLVNAFFLLLAGRLVFPAIAWTLKVIIRGARWCGAKGMGIMPSSVGELGSLGDIWGAGKAGGDGTHHGGSGETGSGNPRKKGPLHAQC